VVCDADDRVVDVVPLVGGQRAVAEIWHLGDEAAILSADVEAGADLVRDTATVEADDGDLLLDVQGGGAKVTDVGPDESAAAKGLNFL
jgi:hypothetical protein